MCRKYREQWSGVPLWKRPFAHDGRRDDPTPGLLRRILPAGRALGLQLFRDHRAQWSARSSFSGFHFGAKDAFIIISTSGIRPLVVEMALGAKTRDLPVIAILSRAHCEKAQPAHPSGKKLVDVADVVIDNLSPVGDCAVALEGLAWYTGPLSTVTGSAIINMLRCETAGMLVERGITPVMLPSHQFVTNNASDEQLENFYEAYRRSLRHLYE